MSAPSTYVELSPKDKAVIAEVAASGSTSATDTSQLPAQRTQLARRASPPPQPQQQSRFARVDTKIRRAVNGRPRYTRQEEDYIQRRIRQRQIAAEIKKRTQQQPRPHVYVKAQPQRPHPAVLPARPVYAPRWMATPPKNQKQRPHGDGFW